MAKVVIRKDYRFFQDDGTLCTSGTIDFLVGGTSTALTVYSDSARTQSLGSQIDIGSTGLPTSSGNPVTVYCGDDETVDYKVTASGFNGGSAFTVPDAAVATETNTTATLGGGNRLLNGGFRFYQRATLVPSNTDDTYSFDGWYVLTQTGAIACSQLGSPETGAIFGGRLTQSQATAQRMGLAQIIEAVNVRDFRGVECVLSGRVKISTATVLRYAILEWTGTENSVTSDIVNSWTNTSYTAGAFFNSTTLSVLAVGSLSCLADTYADIPDLTATPSSSMNNIIVFFWSESALAQNVTLDLNRVQLERGSVSTAFAWESETLERLRCHKHCQPFPGTDGSSPNLGAQLQAQNLILAREPLPVRMRTNPTLLSTSPTWATTAPGATEVAFNNRDAAAYASITGALSVTLNASAGYAELLFNAATSFSGTVGNTGFVDCGSSFQALLLAEI